MSEHYPRICLYNEFEGERYLWIRESVSIAFYMLHQHKDIKEAVMYALEAYQRAMELQALGWYADDEGEWQKLDNKGWEATRKKILTGIGGSICLTGRPDVTTGYKVIYSGYRFDHSEFSTKPDALGGATGLRARLRSPEAVVQELKGEQVVVTLGQWPYQWDGFTHEDMRHWERRFLD